MKNKFVDFIKGIPIGIANVIPGFSGGTMAVILNIYERFINAFSDFFHHPIKIIKDVWALVIGIGTGVILAILVLTYLLNHFPIPTTMFFVGLIIGSIPNIYEKAKIGKTKVTDYIVFFVCVVLVITLPYLGEGEVSNFDFNFKTGIIIFVLSVIASATMVIPGVSGSMVLLAIGYYDIIWVGIIGTFTTALTTLNIQGILSSIIPVIVFGLGVVVGIVLISKLIKLLIAKVPQTVYTAILGLLFASPFAILHGMYYEYTEKIKNSNWVSWVVGILSLAIAAYLVNYLSKFEGDTNE